VPTEFCVLRDASARLTADWTSREVTIGKLYLMSWWLEADLEALLGAIEPPPAQPAASRAVERRASDANGFMA